MRTEAIRARVSIYLRRGVWRALAAGEDGHRAILQLRAGLEQYIERKHLAPDTAAAYRQAWDLAYWPANHEVTMRTGLGAVQRGDGEPANWDTDPNARMLRMDLRLYRDAYSKAEEKARCAHLPRVAEEGRKETAYWKEHIDRVETMLVDRQLGV
jgi:hypothetical protein